jgi:hypothetical protein
MELDAMRVEHRLDCHQARTDRFEGMKPGEAQADVGQEAENLIDHLVETPLGIAGFQPMTRDETHVRVCMHPTG